MHEFLKGVGWLTALFIVGNAASNFGTTFANGATGAASFEKVLQGR